MAVRTRTGGDWTVTSTDDVTGQEFEILHVLWASFDDVGTPHHERTWVDLSGRMRGWQVEGGAENELGEVDATVASYELADPDRDLDPTNGDSPYDPVPNRLLWHRIQADGKTYGVFLGYVNGWGPTPHPDGVDLHTANVTASDGEKILIRGNLEAANPDVVEYDEVVEPLDPAYYYPMTDPPGTKLVAHRRVIRYKKGEKKGKRKRVKRWKTRATRADVAGVSGPSGTYVNTPLLGQPGPIKGDSGTAVAFRSAQSERAKVTVDVADFRSISGLTVFCWVRVRALTPVANFVRGPTNGVEAIFRLGTDSGIELGFKFSVLDAGTGEPATVFGPAVPLNVWVLLAGVWVPNTLRLYFNGVQVATASGPAAFSNSQDGDDLVIGGDPSGIEGFADAVIGRNGVVERALTADQMKALYDAAFLGFDSMRTGRRIEHVLDLVNEFPVWNIQAGVRTMPPGRYAGLEPMELVNDAVAGEGFPSAFFMSKDGVPTNLAADYRGSAPYNAPLFTVGTGMGEIPFLNPQLSDEDEFLFNIISATRESGDETFTASDPTSIGRFGRSVLPLDDLPIGSDADVQDYVNELLALYKDPIVRITGFELNGSTAEERDALLTLDQKDCVRVHFQPEGGGTEIDQTSFVEHRRVWQDHAAEPLIYGEFGVSPV